MGYKFNDGLPKEVANTIPAPDPTPEDGTYTVIYTGTSNYTYYEFVNLTAKGVVIEAGPTGVYTPAAERPILQSATASADGTIITLAFDKAMCDPTTGTTACFSVVVDGQSRTLSAAVRNADTTKIDLTLSGSPVIVQGVIVTLTYSGNYVESLDLGFLADFRDLSVTNNSTVTL